MIVPAIALAIATATVVAKCDLFMTMKYFKSRFAHVIGCGTGNNCLLYHSLSQKKMIVNSDYAIEFKTHPTSKALPSHLVNDDLITAGLIVHNDTDDKAFFNEWRKNGGKVNTKLSTLYLITSLSCNLTCKYCSVQGNHSPNTDNVMSIKTGNEAINWFWKNHNLVANHPKLIFYGGEPLLGYETIIEAATRWHYHAKKQNRVTSVTVITNGTLINETIIKSFKDLGVSLSISLDGPEAINDYNRIYPNGAGSYYNVFNAIKLCRNNNMDFSVSCTINKQNLPYLDEITNWLQTEIRPRGLGFNVIKCRPDLGLGKDYYKAADDFILKAFLKFRDTGLYEDRAMRKVNAFSKPYFHFADCSGLGNQLTINPDGSFGVCHVATENGRDIIGKFTDFPDPANAVIQNELKRWQKSLPIFDNDCLDCSALAICGGGCPLHAELVHGVEGSRDQDFCEHSKNWINFLANETIKYSK